MLIVYIAVAVYFSSHFYEDTEIYGIDCSQKSVEEVKILVADKLDEYRLEVKERGGASEYLSADQIDLKFVDNSSIDRMARAQRSYIWPIMLMMERDDMAGVAFSYDQKKALTAFKDLECMNPIYTKVPTDAYVQVTDSGFEVVKETEGNTLNPETTAKALYAALDGGKSVLDLEEEDCYLKPDLYSDDEALVAEAEAKDVLVQADITYEFGSRQERVNAPVIAQWITQAGDGSYKLSILKSADPEGTACARFFYEYPAVPGLGHFLHTYVCDGNPVIPTFQGEPERVSIPADIDDFTRELWENLNPDNKISLFVRYTDLETRKYQQRILNKHSK